MSKVGRPTKYKSEMCDTLIELMKEGASLTEVICELDISHETLMDWRNSDSPRYNEDFSEAIKKGLAYSQKWWETHARKQLENPKFNSTLWYMNMKNRFGWRDKHEHSGDQSAPIKIVTNFPQTFEDE